MFSLLRWLKQEHGGIKGGLALASLIMAVGAGTIAHNMGGSAPVTANLWLSSTAANDCSGGRSSSLINYSTAVSSNKVCQTWSHACAVTAGGDTVAVKATGNTPFPEEVPGGAYTDLASERGDCSNGAGNAVDPTAQALGTDPASVISNWVTFRCDDETRDSVKIDVKFFFNAGNSHAYINGNCFYFGSLDGDFGGSSGLNSQNIIFNGVHMQALEIKGAKNYWIRNSELGPVVLCGQDGGPEVEAKECDTTAANWWESDRPWEARWATRSNGSSDLNSQGRVGSNTTTSSENVVVDNLWLHDSQSKSSASPDWHSGCMYLLGNQSTAVDNVIWRNIKCERVVHQGMYVSCVSGPCSVTGLTVENSQVACPTEPIDNTLDETEYGQAACGASAFVLTTGSQETVDNLLVRYNSFASPAFFATNTEVLTNVHIIGNIAESYTCPSDVVGDYNVRRVGADTCETNSSAENPLPFADTDYGTGLPISTTRVNFHLSGSYSWENAITPTSSDYALTKDMDLDARTSGARDAGADEK